MKGGLCLKSQLNLGATVSSRGCQSRKHKFTGRSDAPLVRPSAAGGFPCQLVSTTFTCTLFSPWNTHTWGVLTTVIVMLRVILGFPRRNTLSILQRNGRCKCEICGLTEMCESERLFIFVLWPHSCSPVRNCLGKSVYRSTPNETACVCETCNQEDYIQKLESTWSGGFHRLKEAVSQLMRISSVVPKMSAISASFLVSCFSNSSFYC